MALGYVAPPKAPGTALARLNAVSASVRLPSLAAVDHRRALSRAERTMVIRGYDVWPLLKQTGKEIMEDKAPIYAAQMAYTLFFSLFPLLLFAAALLNLVASEQQVMSWMTGNIATALPPDVADLLRTTMEKVITAEGAPGLLSFGLLTVAWSGSAIFGAMMTALNAAYEVQEARPFWKKTLIRLAALAGSGVVLITSTVVLLNGEGVVRWVGDLLGLGAVARTVWMVVQFPLVIAITIGMLWLLYYYLPNCRHQSRKYVLAGVIVTTVLWIGATMLFRLYVQNFSAVNPAYGAIGAIMLLLTWMYVSMLVLLAGGELNSELQKGTGRVDGAERGSSDRRGSGEARRTTGHTHTERADVPRDRALVPVAATGEVHAKLAASLPFVTEGVAVHSGNGRRARPRPLTPDELSGRGLISFVRDLVDGATTLIRRELMLAKIELREAARAVGAGTISFATGAVLALLGTLALVAGFVTLIGDQWLPRDLFWLAALVVTIVAGAAAFVFMRRGRRALTRELRPRETITTVRDDVAWARSEVAALRMQVTPPKPVAPVSPSASAPVDRRGRRTDRRAPRA